MEKETKNNERIDWSKILSKYEVPTVLKDVLLKPYFETVELKEPILDAGCGTGYFSGLLLKRGYCVSGVDLNSHLENEEGFDFCQADLTSFETDKKFETILLINILTTVPLADRLKILKKIKEIKMADGVAYVVNVSGELVSSDFESETLSSHKIGKDKVRLRIKLVSGEHIEFDDYVVTQQEMVEICKTAGLQIIEKKDLKLDDLAKPVYEMYLLR
ncbi:MAG: class I SAM-dependent methyltransferase [Candidatus Paceibacterota bacterium]|jgi:2-polyprenyl-3-methyl-5-hydroxy-6-metoxy-1,4-benzoquinol methylase